MLGLHRDEVAAFVRIRPGHAFQRRVDGLGGAAGKDDLARLGAQAFGHGLPRLLDGLLGGPPKRMAFAGGVAVMLGEKRHHLPQHPLVDGRGGVVVEVDGQLHRRHRVGRACMNPTRREWVSIRE